MPADDRLTVNQNFRVSPTLQKAIEDDASELGISTSAYLRLCVYLAGPLLLQHPALTSLNRRELAELAANVGNAIVIRPAVVSLGLPGVLLPGGGLGMEGEIDPRR